ncbi:hypothetical protein C8P63_12627 [Melghirimyces profundicolus]|uniref:Uncharacterized protein n=1 Tax=Melghirimyces profundicolus TaxID=1242148 RepID=A0A2T6BCF0_9BACL|nr:hypothetical protein [Melghirimyces profundicolus]PTX53741.1 hypothetical protein C8P63_12627 [Melghirimyces profundicolus]
MRKHVKITAAALSIFLLGTGTGYAAEDSLKKWITDKLAAYGEAKADEMGQDLERYRAKKKKELRKWADKRFDEAYRELDRYAQESRNKGKKEIDRIYRETRKNINNKMDQGVTRGKEEIHQEQAEQIRKAKEDAASVTPKAPSPHTEPTQDTSSQPQENTEPTATE